MDSLAPCQHLQKQTLATKAFVTGLNYCSMACTVAMYEDSAPRVKKILYPSELIELGKKALYVLAGVPIRSDASR